MLIKIIGALCIIGACAGAGFEFAATHKRTERSVRLLITEIEYIQQELRYRMSPLPDILRQIGGRSDGIVGDFFNLLTEELDKQISPNIKYCVDAVIGRLRNMPEPIKKGIVLLGSSLGQFDVEGQLHALDSVKKECIDILKALTTDQDMRLRNYQTITICAGVAVAILFI